MLVSLHVRNLALIEETEVFFQPGLNILTGETGAGKSVILGSVALALGAKADRDMIRTGAEYALIELTFEGSEEVREALRRMDLPAEDNQIILQRRVMPNRSICRINGETVPIRQMRELAGLLIDIHGQHDSQILLQTKRHLEILDAYAEKELPHVKEAYAACWHEHSAILQEIAENELDEQTRKREISLAEFERDEIEEANLQAGEDEQLERDYRRMVNGRKIAETLNLVHGLTGEEEGNGAGELTGRALRELSQALSCDDGLGQLVQLLADVDGLLNDFNRAVSEYLSDLEFDEEQLSETENRLNTVNHLKDKYGSTIEEVLAYAEQKNQELDRLLHQEEWLEQKRGDLCADAGIFPAPWNGAGLWADGKAESAELFDKALYFDYARNAADAAADSGLFCALLCVWNENFQKLPDDRGNSCICAKLCGVFCRNIPFWNRVHAGRAV